ncbi:MAG: ABC transporter permease [Rhodospirillaceae bacterium]|nr:ABC transporter permease [Rhodospirillaceae bacterium]
MLHNYLTIALRNLLKNKLYAAINIFGLTVGLAACLMILLFVREELSFDRWVPDAERIYRLHTRFDIPNRLPLLAVAAPGPAKPALEKDFAEIEAAVRLVDQRAVVKRGSDVFFEEVVLADANVFDVLSLPFAAGERSAALVDASSLVLSEAMAKKYFGDAPAVGQVLTITFSFGTRDMRVTGVFKDLPSNTHLKLDFIGHLIEAEFDQRPWVLKSWTSINTSTYVKLKTDADIAAIRRAMPAFEERHLPGFNIGGRDLKAADFMELSLVALPDLHLKSRGTGGFKPAGDATVVATFSAVALLILLIACINFTNLATARASLRAREVALRKVLGAHRRQLIVQFLGESLLLAAIALVLAVGVVAAALPVYNQLLGRELALTVGDGGLWAGMLGLVVLVGVVGGFYPALYLSRFAPARILKANRSSAATSSGRLRGVLVVVQFAVSIGLMICTAVVYGQTRYLRNMDLGFNTSGLLTISGLGRDAARNVGDALRAELARIPGVTGVTRAGEEPGDQDENNTLIEIPGQISDQPLVVGVSSVDYDFFSVMEIPILAGRPLSKDFPADDFDGSPDELAARNGNVVLSRGALKLLGLTDPSEAVGRELRMSVGGEGNRKQMTVTVVGVAENVRYDSGRAEIRPMLYQVRPRTFDYVFLRVRNADPARVQDEAARVWRELVPEQPFVADFVATKLAAQFDSEAARGTLFAAFAGLAVVIACLGLYGLASFTAERRTKEIGMRKVLGARVRDIVRLLAWDFSKPVLAANLIAWPAAWALMRDWLNGFESRIDLSPLLFLVAGSLALAIALATVAVHTARVARANPIHALRYE